MGNYSATGRDNSSSGRGKSITPLYYIHLLYKTIIINSLTIQSEEFYLASIAMTAFEMTLGVLLASRQYQLYINCSQVSVKENPTKYKP